MRKTTFIILMIIAFTFSSCNKPIHEYRDHQSVSSPINIESSFESIDISAAGLNDVKLLYKNKAYITPDSWADIYVFYDDRFGQGIPFDSYLAVCVDGKMVISDIDFSLGNTEVSLPAYSLGAYVCDVDADGFDEFIIQQCVAISGGAGGYHSRIFKYVNGEISTIFDSDSIQQFDTGYRNEITENAEIEIYNIFTNMSNTYTFSTYNQDYMKWFYNDNGEIIQRSMLIDSFNEFTPQDVDYDGVYEIVCKQYVSLISHADALGHVRSVLKYDTKNKSFFVYKAEMLPYEKLNEIK